MNDHIDTLLEMAEYFKAIGEAELAAKCRETATRMCDYILFMEGRVE